MRHLCFQVYGALSAWGSHMGQTARDTQRAPTKSAILGLVAGGLGVTRQEDKTHRHLSESLGFGVAIYDDGFPLRDLQRVDSVRLRKRRDFALPTRRAEVLFLQDRPTSGATEYGRQTKLTRRDYRTDAYYHVALWLADEEDEVNLSHLQNALEQPTFTPYLGRKACVPALPFAPAVVNESSLKETFQIYLSGLPASTTPRDNLKLEEAWFEDHPSPGFDLEAAEQHRRRDAIQSRQAWSFQERTEFRVQGDFH